jgi:hypothetical protein
MDSTFPCWVVWLAYSSPGKQACQRLHTPEGTTLNDFTLAKIPASNRQSSAVKAEIALSTASSFVRFSLHDQSSTPLRQRRSQPTMKRSGIPPRGLKPRGFLPTFL